MVFRYPDQQQWIIRATNGNGLIYCKSRDEAKQKLQSIFRVNLFSPHFHFNQTFHIHLG